MSTLDWPVCPDCGKPVRPSVAFLTGRDTCTAVPLPPVCMSPECVADRAEGQAERDAEAIARMIAKGVIDP